MESKKGAAASLTCLLLLGMLIVLPSGFNSFCAAEATTASSPSGGICGFQSKVYQGLCIMGVCADVCQHKEGALYGMCLPFVEECLCVSLCSARYDSKEIRFNDITRNIKNHINFSLQNRNFKADPTQEDYRILHSFGFQPPATPKQLKLVRWIPPIAFFSLNVDGASQGVVVELCSVDVVSSDLPLVLLILPFYG
ncbi:hypothetical protein Taro_026557 [Colocasia esculenta]|uniref:Uncharacterized protein n=1 Tax=Colocasia esculenta TaxID=4460 RepID=A0A843VHH0_COLES|nr:hypothetical protein [Colocasia esculenta]